MKNPPSCVAPFRIKMAEGKSRRVAQSEDLSNVEFETSEDVDVIPTFDNMGLRDELLRGIYAYGEFFIAKSASQNNLTSLSLVYTFWHLVSL